MQSCTCMGKQRFPCPLPPTHIIRGMPSPSVPPVPPCIGYVPLHPYLDVSSHPISRFHPSMHPSSYPFIHPCIHLSIHASIQLQVSVAHGSPGGRIVVPAYPRVTREGHQANGPSLYVKSVNQSVNLSVSP